jgi:poly(hydroxyalkanoate) granule-associated protein
MATAKSKSFSDMVNESAREIWLAGLGTFSVVEKEGTKLFNEFIKKGKELEGKGEKLEKDMKSKFESASKKDEIGRFIEDNMHKAFETFGIATNSEVKDLTKKVDKLSENVAALSKSLSEKKSKPEKPTTSVK